MVVKKSDEKAIDESIATSEKVNISDEHALSTAESQKAVSLPGQFKGVDIEGLESVPMAMVAVPYVRLIQPTSQKTEDVNGKEVLAGNFLFNDTLKPMGDISFVLLRAKVADVTFKREDGDVTSPRLSILGVTTEGTKLFILSLSPTSFSNFGRLIAQLKDAKIKQTWRFVITVSSEKKENAKGKFYVAKFAIGEELEPKDMEEMETKAREYGVVLDRQPLDEDADA